MPADKLPCGREVGERSHSGCRGDTGRLLLDSDLKSWTRAVKSAIAQYDELFDCSCRSNYLVTVESKDD